MKTTIKLMLLSILYWGSAGQAAHPSIDPVIAKIREDFTAATTPSENFLLINPNYPIYSFDKYKDFYCRKYEAYGTSFKSYTYSASFDKFNGFILSKTLTSDAFESPSHYLFNDGELSAITHYAKKVGKKKAPLLKPYISRITLRMKQNNILIAEFSTNEPTKDLTAPPLAYIANPVKGEYVSAYAVCR